MYKWPLMAGPEAHVSAANTAPQHCLLQEYHHPSEKLPHLSSSEICTSRNQKEDLLQQKDSLACSDSWISVSSPCSPRKTSSMYSEQISEVKKDYQSALDENFMMRLSRSDEFDSLKAEDISLGSFAYIKTIPSEETIISEFSHEQGVIPEEMLETEVCGSPAWEYNIMESAHFSLSSHIHRKHEEARNFEHSRLVEKSSLLETECALGNTVVGSGCDCLENFQNDMLSKNLQSKGTVSWRTAGAKELAALVAKKSLEHLENCDLPPGSPLVKRWDLESCDLSCSKGQQWGISHSGDRDVVLSALHVHEPVSLETQRLSSSQFSSHSHSSPLPHPVAQSLGLKEHIKPSTGEDQLVCRCLWKGRSGASASTWITGCEGIQGGDHGPQLLGEALCHSQTRAREAEKIATQAFLEQEELTKLFFRESLLSFTYRQWAHSLEAENTCLRMRAEEVSQAWLKQRVMNPYATFDFFSTAGWEHLGKDFEEEEWKQDFSDGVKRSSNLNNGWSSPKDEANIGCYSLRVAISLGLSLAGAGLILGLSMGCIFLVPLQSWNFSCIVSSGARSLYRQVPTVSERG